MFKSSTCYGRTCRLLGKSKAKCILWGEGKCESNTDKLLGLSKLIQSGTASNITEAIEMDKNGVGKTETN